MKTSIKVECGNRAFAVQLVELITCEFPECNATYYVDGRGVAVMTDAPRHGALTLARMIGAIL